MPKWILLAPVELLARAADWVPIKVMVLINAMVLIAAFRFPVLWIPVSMGAAYLVALAGLYVVGTNSCSRRNFRSRVVGMAKAAYPVNLYWAGMKVTLLIFASVRWPQHNWFVLPLLMIWGWMFSVLLAYRKEFSPFGSLLSKEETVANEGGLLWRLGQKLADFWFPDDDALDEYGPGGYLLPEPAAKAETAKADSDPCLTCPTRLLSGLDDSSHIFPLPAFFNYPQPCVIRGACQERGEWEARQQERLAGEAPDQKAAS